MSDPIQPIDPSKPGLSYERQQKAAELVRDVFQGTLHMRAQGQKYLPRFPRESQAAWEIRKDTAVLYNAVETTVVGLTGMLFRENPKLGDDVPTAIRGDDESGTGGYAENIDLQGRHLDVFARDVAEAALVDGHTYILVDYPRVDPGRIRTLADEREAGLRPYWVHILKRDLLSWRTATVNGQAVLTQIVWRACVTEADGPFGEKEVEEIRVYRRPTDEAGVPVAGTVTFEAWRKRKVEGREAWSLVEEGQTTSPNIKLATVYGRRTGFMESKPQLLDLALENVRHYQLVSDNDNVLHVASVPQLVLIGLDEGSGDQTVGPANAWKVQQGGDVKYAEPQGVALEAGRQRIQDSEGRMAVLGLAMLQKEQANPQTATGKRIDRAEKDSGLMALARGLQDGLEEALQYTAEWIGETDGGSVTVNTDFIDQTLDAQMVAALGNLVAEGKLTQETLWEALKRGVPVLSFLDPDKEAALLEGVGMGAPALSVIPSDVGGEGGDGPTADPTAERERRLAEAERKIDALLQKLDPEFAQQLKEAA